VRKRYGDAALIVGFTTYTGTVTAASDWGAPAERKRVRPALAGSWESIFHQAAEPRLVLETAPMEGRRLERAIGVIYRPDTERVSHYFRAHLAQQFDAVMHIDETEALEPLEPWSRTEADLPETYPTAL
jgi:erythromycin esterase-like protein